MTQYSTLHHPVLKMIAWDQQRPAEWVNDHVILAHATSNSHVIVGDDGDVVINAGTAHQGARLREKFEELLGRPLRVAKLIFTQSHPDHTGGWQAFVDPGTELVGQEMFPPICAERKMLGPFFAPRNARVLAAMMPPGVTHNWFDTPDPEPMATFFRSAAFEVSARRYELLVLPSGETLDSLAVWLPDERTLFSGNWAGAIFGALPNFYTARGDRARSVPGWLKDCEKVLALGPELLITGHEDPIRGRERIAAELGKVRDAVQFIHDHTVAGMREGRTVSEIQGTLQLPPHLQPRDGRCPPHWIARSVYEEYAGWFKHELTSELYPTSAQSIWPDLAEMVGGATRLADHARAQLAAGDPEKALHFIEIAIAAAPEDTTVRETELAILDALADQTQGGIFDLLGWLEGRMIAARAALAAISNA